MKNRKNVLGFILSLSLATTGTTSLAVLATENGTFAQSSKPSSVQVNAKTAQKEKANFDLVESISIIITVITAFVGVLTYYFNESWKRRQYLEEKIKDFEGKIETTNVRKMLSAELQCIELFPFLEKPTHRFVVVEDCLWAEALLECKCNKKLKEQHDDIDKDHEHYYQQKPAVKACIRDNFNRYLNHLQQFEKMIKSGIVNQKTLEVYLEPWFEFIDSANNEVNVNCPSSGEEYLPKEALLEYMGLLEGTPEEELSIIQKDVRALVKRFRPLSSLTSQSKQTSSHTLDLLHEYEIMFFQKLEIFKTPYKSGD